MHLHSVKKERLMPGHEKLHFYAKIVMETGVQWQTYLKNLWKKRPYRGEGGHHNSWGSSAGKGRPRRKRSFLLASPELALMTEPEPKQWVINSHRGVFKSGQLENSAQSYVDALLEGANMLECDVRRTKDGELVLIHNRTIDGVAKHATKLPDPAEFGERPLGPVRDHTLAYLKAMEFPEGAKIMTVAEFLAFLKQYRVGAQVELKEIAGVLPKLLDDVAAADIDYSTLAVPIVITSFNWTGILRLRKLLLRRPDIPRHKFPDMPGLALGLQAIKVAGAFGRWILRRCQKRDIWGFCTYYKWLSPALIGYAHHCGVRFVPRVPDDESLIGVYIRADVDGFETNNVPFIRDCITRAGFEVPPLPDL
ncbi:MAG TPA: glycerophosphodiester phosphodiesterase family protein [Candidatus Lokiarchaeia archaeon]|nr:glycerophosphodiester phosphodiesterase family protein [Candidatus Lokiarchaeia archaeon]